MSGRRQPSFSFIVHPRSVNDLNAYGAIGLLRRYSSDDTDYLRKVRLLPPVLVGEVVFGACHLRGEIIAVPRLPPEMFGADAARGVAEGVAVAAHRGAQVIGLGGLTAPATGGGERLLRRLPNCVTLTNGNALTAAVIRSNVEEARALLGLGRRAHVGVVGCTGSVGTALTHLLAEAGYDLILVGRSLQRLAHKFDGIARAVHAIDLTALKRADIVVLLTNDPQAALHPEHVARGCIVIDAAQPANVPEQDYADFSARGIAVCAGGVVRVPNLTCTCNFGFCARGETFACLAETYLMARNGLRQHSTGVPSADYAKRLWRLAAREGIEVRPLFETACCPVCPAPAAKGWELQAAQ
jgi:fatty aldehyde-generating acyl-ACP reductase